MARLPHCYGRFVRGNNGTRTSLKRIGANVIKIGLMVQRAVDILPLETNELKAILSSFPLV